MDRAMHMALISLFFFLPNATSPAVISGITLLVLWVLSGRFLVMRHRWLGRPWAWPVYVMMLLPWVGLLYGPGVEAGWQYAEGSHFWLYAFAVASMDLDEATIKRLLRAFVAGLLVVSAVSFIHFLGFRELISLEEGVPSVYTGMYITASLMLVFAMLVLSFWFREARGGREKVVVLILMLVFVFTLALGKGRSGYVAFVLLSPIMFYNLFGRRGLLKTAAACVLIVVALGLSTTVRERVVGAVDDVKAYQRGEASTSAGERFYMWQGAIDIFKRKPLVGAGTGSYESEMERFSSGYKGPIPAITHFPDPHNSYFYMLASFGIIGLLALLWLFAIMLRSGLRARRTLAGYSVLVFTLVLMIGSLSATQTLMNATGIMFGLFAGMQEHLDG